MGRTDRRGTEAGEPVDGVELAALQVEGDSGERGHWASPEGYIVTIARELVHGTLVALLNSQVSGPARYVLITAPVSRAERQARAFEE